MYADLSGRFSPLRSRSAPAQMIFFNNRSPLRSLPLMPFSARSAPFSAPLTCSAGKELEIRFGVWITSQKRVYCLSNVI